MSYHKRKKTKSVAGKSLIAQMNEMTQMTNMTQTQTAETFEMVDQPTVTNMTTNTQASTVEQSTSIPRTPISERKKRKTFKKTKRSLVPPPPPLPPEPERIPIVKTLFDGANVRTFYGIEDTPIQKFLSDVIQNIPLVRIDELDDQGGVLNTYEIESRYDKSKGRKNPFKKKKKKKKKFSIIKGDTKDSYKTKTPQEKKGLTQIVEENRYNISIDGVPGQAYPITFMGLENPDEVSAYMYDDPPIVPIPASLPESYQNSANDGVEALKDGRRCGNCIFYDPEVSVCNKWNAEVRQYYWCLSWQTMAPVIAEPNEFTQHIIEDGDIYDYFLNKVKDPLTQEPNLANFLSPFNTLFAQYGAYIYGDYLRRVVDSGDAFDYDGVPLNFFFTTQEGFLNAIDFINNSNLGAFDDPPEEYDSIQQSLVTYTLTKKSTSTLPDNYPQIVTINLHGSYYGEPINILSQLDLTNAKLAYNPQVSVDTHHILKDNRFDQLETQGVVHVDIVKQSIRERLLKFLVDNSREYRLDGTSSYLFIQWVADRTAFTESLQALYQLLLTVPAISSENQELLDAITLSLSEQLFDDPSNTFVPLTTTLVETEESV